MAVWQALDEVERPSDGSVVTIGNFDGVHLGHITVLHRASRWASEQSDDGRSLPVVVVTFEPHPMQVLLPERAPMRLTAVEHRAELLQRHGADHVLVLRFDEELASWSPEEFVRRVLVDVLNASAVVVGDNFRFGARASGTVDTLRELAPALGFEVDAVPLEGDQHPYSSTGARQAVSEGDMRTAADILGRLHSVRGVVVEGEHRGHELGFPTANVPTDQLTAVPPDGVYAGWMRRLDAEVLMPAAISVGSNPTFDGQQRRVESYVLDREDLELYGVAVEVCFVARLRGQIRFTSVDDLVVRIRSDVEEVRRVLAAHTTQAL